MAVYLQVENLTKSYGDRLLFASVTFGINEGDKIGLIAKNGTGKSTLLRIMAGEEGYDSGRITARNGLRTAFLPQQTFLGEGGTLRDFLDREPGDDDCRLRLREYLDQGGLTDLDLELKSMSGGEQKRVAIARVLAARPNLLILDEPTNHLDITTIEWLEGVLTRSRTTLLMVTHDRYFLEAVCNKIIEIDERELYTYPGSYRTYLEKRAQRIEAMEADVAKARNLLRKEQDWMSRQPQARAGKARYRINAFYDLKDKAAQRRDDRTVAIDSKDTYIGNKIFAARNVCKAFGDKPILNDFTYDFARYDKVGIVGRNGVGKSTFVKMLLGHVQPDSGSFDVGQTVRFGYYSQNRAVFPPEKKVIDAVTDIAESVETGTGRTTALEYLKRFLFSAKDQQKYIANLSGGELCRLYLATVLMQQPNFLILDEPTNDLDIVTLGILQDYLADFKGCALIISHDRYFLDTIVDHLFVLEGDGTVRDFPGNYTDYRAYVRESRQPKPSASESAPAKAKAVNRRERMSYKEKQELAALEADLERVNSRIAALESMFNSGQPLDDAAALAAEYRELKDDLEVKEMRWLELSEKEQ